MIEYIDDLPVDVAGLKVHGKLTHADYQDLLPKLEAKMADHKKLRVLFVMEDFHGWELGAAWDDLKFEMAHCKDFGRCAIVGEKKWEEWMVKISKPFYKGDVKYFDHGELEQAKAWLTEA